LVQRFVLQAQEANPRSIKRDIDPKALEKISSYGWPGNVRELRNCVFEAVNNHPDVEHLVAEHIKIPEQVKPQISVPGGAPSEAQTLPSSATIREIVRFVSSSSFDGTPPDELVGRLPELQASFARLMAGYLKAALMATRKLTLQNTKGKLLIHPAAKLIMGNRRLSASKAADIVKKLLTIHPESTEQLLSDPVLREAYEIALRLRPRRGKNEKKRNGNGA
jgi:transcriptional regulator of acetoin/glycerol metabolism